MVGSDNTLIFFTSYSNFMVKVVLIRVNPRQSVSQNKKGSYMSKISTSVIIPAHNEADSIGQLVSIVRELHPEFEILVINDGSTDEIAENAKSAGAAVYSHPYNIGNCAAVKSSTMVAKRTFFVDGDGQHRPEDIGRMLEIFTGCDMAVGESVSG